MTMQSHPESIRKEAVELFRSGYGYKATATILGILPSTVRDWRRKWASSASEEEIVRFDKALKEVMEERQMRYIWSVNEEVLLEAYRRAVKNRRSAFDSYAKHRVQIGLGTSPLFERMPININVNQNKHCAVYKLL